MIVQINNIIYLFKYLYNNNTCKTWSKQKYIKIMVNLSITQNYIYYIKQRHN